MKFRYNIEDLDYGYSHGHHGDMPAYYGAKQMVEDLERVIEFHTMKYREQKAEFIQRWGQDEWDEQVAKSNDRHKK